MARDGLTDLLRDTAWHLFVDGENFAIRGGKVLKDAGCDPTIGPYRRDVYLWLPRSLATFPFFAHRPRGGGPLGGALPDWRVVNATRAYYYTSTTSDEPAWSEIRLELRALGFEPRLFRKVGDRSKAVDIALATDSLMLAAEGRSQATVIMSGDGDFVPVVDALKRLGQRVIVCAFGSSTNREMVIAADDFIDLEPLIVSRWREHLENIERDRQFEAQQAKAEPT